MASIPQGAIEHHDLILVESEVTGHQHAVRPTRGVRRFGWNGSHYLEIAVPVATIVHPEHRAIELARGVYRVWRQREYTGAARSRPVQD